MENFSPEYKIFLDNIYKDFIFIGPFLKKCKQNIESSEEYEYPVILASMEEESPLGEPLIIKNSESPVKINYFASYLDLIVSAGFLPIKSLEEFKKLYDQKENHCCIMTIYQKIYKIIFIPFFQDVEKQDEDLLDK